MAKQQVSKLPGRFGSRALVALASATIAVISGLAVEPIRASVRNPEDLLIVDCLLPGQVRKLGKVSTFMTARRPIRTTQADCEIRGGEFTSFDRANYETALKVWMQQAEGGDAEAQNYVGEIYAKGLGTDPDYAKARSWYEKSAAQGSKRAKINLGYLYEEGLGVEKDLPKALNLYREASGATSDDLVFASTVTVSAEAQAEIASLKQTVEEQKAEQEKLKAKVRELEGQLSDRRRQLGAAQHELEATRNKLVVAQEKASSPQAAADLEKLKKELAEKEAAIAKEREALDRDRAALSEKTKADQAKLADLRSQQSTLEKKPATDAASKKDLERVRSAAAEMALALDDAYAKIAALESNLSANDTKRAAEQARFDDERKKMQSALASSKADRELMLLLEQELGQKQKEVSRQRDQIAALETQFKPGGSSAAGSGAVASIASLAGPALELIEPALTVTRGKPAAMVRSTTTTDIVGKVVAQAGIASLNVNGTVVPVAANGTFRASIEMAKDGTPVQVAAIDKNGKKSSLDFLVLPQPGAAATASGSAKAPAGARGVPSDVKLGKYYALVIGNNDYGAFPKLTSAGNDAKAVAEVLKSRYGMNTRLLLNASKMDILSALNDLRETLKAEDNLVVYYAGHGELDRPKKEGYWVPVDGQQGAAGSWISNRAISDILNTMNAKHVLVVADSCYSGALTRASVPVGAAVPDAQWATFMKKMSDSRSRTALSSGGLAPVADSSSGQNSYFARSLIAALQDNNQVMEGQKLFRQVTAGLALAAAESTLIQAPEYAPIAFSGHEAGEFFFVPKG